MKISREAPRHCIPTLFLEWSHAVCADIDSPNDLKTIGGAAVKRMEAARMLVAKLYLYINGKGSCEEFGRCHESTSAFTASS